jgi:hypothetical protein
MREEYTTDKKGRRVRLLHPAATKADTGEQLVLWDDAEPIQVVFDFTMDLDGSINELFFSCRRSADMTPSVDLA